MAQLHNAEFTVRYMGQNRSRSGYVFEISGPEHLIEDGMVIHIRKRRPEWLDESLPTGTVLSSDVVVNSDLIQSYFSRSAFDVASQSYYAREYGCSYLSDSGADAELLSDLSEPFGEYSPADVIRELTHQVPLFSDIPTSQLLALRQQFPEAFSAYRSALSQSIQENADLLSGGRIRARQFFRDVLEPKLEQLRATEVSANRLQKRNLLLSFGLPVISLTAGAIASSLPASVAGLLEVGGGLGIVEGLVDPLLERNKKRAELESNQYFFLLQMDKARRSQFARCDSTLRR